MHPDVGEFCLYEVLGVDAGVSPEQLRAQYRRLMQKAHPDMGGTSDIAARLNHAYRILSDPVARDDYDQRLNILRCVARGLDFAEKDTNRIDGQARCINDAHACQFCGSSYKGNPLLTESRCVHCDSPLASPLVESLFSDGRRAAHRSTRRLPVRFIEQADGEKAYQATTKDLSMAGVLLVSAQGLKAGQRIRIVSDVFEAVAEVARCQQQRSAWRSQFLTGLRFRTLHMLRTKGGFVSETV